MIQNASGYNYQLLWNIFPGHLNVIINDFYYNFKPSGKDRLNKFIFIEIYRYCFIDIIVINLFNRLSNKKLFCPKLLKI